MKNISSAIINVDEHGIVRGYKSFSDEQNVTNIHAVYNLKPLLKSGFKLDASDFSYSRSGNSTNSHHADSHLAMGFDYDKTKKNISFYITNISDKDFKKLHTVSSLTSVQKETFEEAINLSCNIIYGLGDNTKELPEKKGVMRLTTAIDGTLTNYKYEGKCNTIEYRKLPGDHYKEIINGTHARVLSSIFVHNEVADIAKNTIQYGSTLKINGRKTDDLQKTFEAIITSSEKLGLDVLPGSKLKFDTRGAVDTANKQKAV